MTPPSTRQGRPRGAAWLALGTLAALAALALALGAQPLRAFIEARVQDAIRAQVVWQPDSPKQTAARFGDNTDPAMPPLTSTFRFLNITNVADVRAGAKPILQEVGPYVFQSLKVKTQVAWSGDGSSVRWHEYRYFRFMPEASAPGASLDDPISTLNVPLAGALEVIGGLGLWRAKKIVQMLAAWIEKRRDPRVQGLFTTRGVGELLFGYEDELLKQLSRFVPGLSPSFGFQPNMTSPADADADFPTTANTGLGNLASVWQLQEWHNVSGVSSWSPPHVERVRGTDGMQFAPGLAVGDSVELWLGEIYRAIKLVAGEKIQEAGVPLLRLRFDPKASEPDPRFFQYVRGLWNITSPTAGGPGGPPGKAGPPIFLSRPHYCGADPALAKGVVGLRCQPHKHDTHIDVEPNTGITLGASVRLMMSSWFGQRWSMIDGKVSDTFLPIFWVEVGSAALPGQLRQFRPLLWARAAEATLDTHAHAAAAGLAAVAVLALAAGAVLRCSSSSDESGYETPAAAAAAASGGGGRRGAGLGQEQRQPLLPNSFPVAADEEAAGEQTPPEQPDGAQQAEQGEEGQASLLGSVLGRVPLLRRFTSGSPTPPAAHSESGGDGGGGEADATASEAAPRILL